MGLEFNVTLGYNISVFIYVKIFQKQKWMALGDSAPTTLLQPMPLKSRFLSDAVLPAKRHGQAMAFDVITL